MLPMISLKRLTVGVRLWNSKFVMHSILLDASAYLLQSLSAARNRRLSMRRKPPFRLNISRPMPCLTGRGFLSVPLSHPPPKNRNGPSFNMFLILSRQVNLDVRRLCPLRLPDVGRGSRVCAGEVVQVFGQ